MLTVIVIISICIVAVVQLYKNKNAAVKGVSKKTIHNETFVTKVESIFNQVVQSFPNRDIHFHLTEAYLQIINNSGTVADINNEFVQSGASVKTQLFAFLPKENAGRVLGIYMLHEIDSAGCEQDTELQEEFNNHMAPIVKMMQSM